VVCHGLREHFPERNRGHRDVTTSPFAAEFVTFSPYAALRAVICDQGVEIAVDSR